MDYEPAAIDLALSWTGGYPFYIQQLGKHAWNLAHGSPIPRADIEAAIPAAQVALDASILPGSQTTEAKTRPLRRRGRGRR